MRRTLLAAALLPLMAAACDDGATGSQSANAPVALSFTVAGPSANRVAEPGFHASAAAGSLTVAGTNGTLAVNDVRIIVSRFELRRVPGSCPVDSTAVNDDRGGDDGHHSRECNRFRAGPRVLTLPLDGGTVTVATDSVPAGTYGSVRFKVENLDDERGEIEHHGGGDDDHDSSRDATEGADLQAVLAAMRTTYPSFPSNASMVVQGTFTPTGGGAARPFTVYFRTNLSVEKPLDPPVVFPGAQSVSVVVDPSLWFKLGAQVLDLSALDGQTVRFADGIARGFHHGEHH